MRTVSVLFTVVGSVLVLTNLRNDAGEDVALGPAPVARPCQVGAPTRMTIPALGVDASVEAIGLDTKVTTDASGRAPLGTPANRHNAGWYADGPKPGAGTGTVLMNGHTYRDGTAIFTSDFASQVAAGQQIDVVVDNGTTCSYRIALVWRDMDAGQEYPQLVDRQGLYDQQGPERLFLETCSGPWLPEERKFRDITVVLAMPVRT